MGNINKMLAFARSKEGKVTYSMSRRLGSSSYDCSSFVYYCLIKGSFLPAKSPIGTTEDLFKLKGKIFDEVFSYKALRPGDIFIRGGQGTSLGKRGHTGIFLDKNRIIHCNARYATVSINPCREFLDQKVSRNERYFRPKNGGRENHTPLKEEDIKLIKYENRHAKVLEATNIRTLPSLKGEIVGLYPKGGYLNYDSVYYGSGFYRLSYIARSGKRRYVAFKSEDGYRRMDFS